jgi:glucokinase
MELGGIGVAFPGPFDIENAVPLMQHKFRKIYGLNMREFIRQVPGVPNNSPIKFIHDANAVLAGELWRGNAIDYTNVAVVTLGTGLGFAISRDKKILYNEIGGPYLSIFGIPYKDGVLEDYTAKRGFLRIYNELNGNSDTEKIKVSDIGKWADEGDENSILTFRRVGEFLSDALKNIIEEKKIECLLFGGQISRSFHHLAPSLQNGLKDISGLQQILPVKNIDNAALLGALSTVI